MKPKQTKKNMKSLSKRKQKVVNIPQKLSLMQTMQIILHFTQIHLHKPNVYY